jgi:succinoglycan biosynthesis protein ExoO
MNTRPDVAILMANYNGAPFIAAAIRSVRRQTLTSWELIIVDDASTDDSITVAEHVAAGDARIKILRQPANRGPGAARNRALDVATARWIAIVDSDDLILPHRLERLLECAEASGAALVADNLLEFSARAKPRPFLPSWLGKERSWISLDTFVRSNSLYSRIPPLGYLKPMIRADLVHEFGLRYDESLRIAEDYYFLVGLMMRGYRLLLAPASLYLYRKHENSVSHRMRAADITALIAAEQRFHERKISASRRVKAALRRRERSLHSLLAFDRVITALKSGDLLAAMRHAGARPHMWPLLLQPLLARLRRLKPRQKSLMGDEGATLEAMRLDRAAARPSGAAF